MAFKEFLEENIRLNTGEPPRICLLDRSGTLTYVLSKIKHLEEAMKRSTHVFLYLTKGFCDDAWSEMQKDEVLMESIHNPEKRWCVVPVYTQPRRNANPDKAYNIPFGLKSLNGIDLSRMSKG